MSKLAPTHRNQSQGVLFTSSGVSLSVGSGGEPIASAIIQDSDFDGLVDLISFDLGDPTDSVYYKINGGSTGSFTLWSGSDISVGATAQSLFYYAQSSAGRQGKTEGHILNSYNINVWGERLVSGSVLRIFTYDFGTKTETLFTQITFTDIGSLYRQLVEVFGDDLATDGNYYIQVENPSGERSPAQPFKIDFTPFSNTGYNS